MFIGKNDINCIPGYKNIDNYYVKIVITGDYNFQLVVSDDYFIDLIIDDKKHAAGYLESDSRLVCTNREFFDYFLIVHHTAKKRNQVLDIIIED